MSHQNFISKAEYAKPECWSSGLFFTATVIHYYQYYKDLQGKFRFK